MTTIRRLAIVCAVAVIVSFAPLVATQPSA